MEASFRKAARPGVETLPVLGEAEAVVRPREAALHDPALGQQSDRLTISTFT